MSRCAIYTDLHEIGHSVGLAHGPENQSWQASGYLFPEFGHGWNDICRLKDDLMSYGNEESFTLILNYTAMRSLIRGIRLCWQGVESGQTPPTHSIELDIMCR